MYEIDQSAHERDVEIKLGLGSWVLFVWAIPLGYVVVWFGLLTLSTALRALLLVLASLFDGLAAYGIALALDRAATFSGRLPLWLAPLLVFAALAAAFWARTRYRRYVLRHA